VSVTILQLPDGENIPASAPVGVVQPYANQATVAAFINLNFLMRPPLLPEEIALMTIDEVTSLYYGIRQIAGCTVIPNRIISAGLGPLGVQHEFNLQQRIYSARPDLWTVSDGTNTYRVLVDPSLLNPPACQPTGIRAIIADPTNLGHLASLGAVLVAPYLSGLLAGLGQAAVHAGAAYENLGGSEIVTSRSTIRKANAATAAANFNDEITAGIKLAKALGHDPLPDAIKVTRLGSLYHSWQNSLAGADALARSVNPQGVHINDAAHKVFEASGIGAYIARWTPYTKFFWSDTVQGMVFPETAGHLAISAPVAAGLGIGALLLLAL